MGAERSTLGLRFSGCWFSAHVATPVGSGHSIKHFGKEPILGKDK